MEFDIEKTMCKKCEGINKCTKYCELHAGRALVNFIKNVDVVETKIGEFGSRVIGGKQDLVVSGHQIYGTDLAYGTILTDISTVLDATQKFNNAFNKTPIQIINVSKSQLQLSNEEAQDIANMVSKLAKNKVVIVPLKPGQQCSVVPNEGCNASSSIDCDIKTIIWRTDKEKHKLEATVIFENRKGGQSIKYPISGYIEKFKLKSMSLPAKGEKIDDNIIKMSNYGIIRPIIIKDKKQEIAVDGTYCYNITDSGTTIIGAWNMKGELIVFDTIKCKAMTKLTENMSFIRRHKKYIAPYKLYDANIIEV